MGWLILTLSIVGLAVATLFLWQTLDRRLDGRACKQLIPAHSLEREYFSLSIVSDQPEPVQRFFKIAIRDGTLIQRVVEIDMRGELSLSTKERWNYRPMRARQTSAPPFGFVWSLS